MNTDIPPADNGVQILVAEDSPTQAQRLQHLLQQEGYRVTLTPNGRVALETARRHKPALIISDINMPEMDGYELCRQVKTDPTLSDIAVILVTTMSDPQGVIRGLECRADNFLLKPYEPGILLQRVRYAISSCEMRVSERAGMGVEIQFNGQAHFITADRLQILNLLLSTYDAAILRNNELRQAEEKLRAINHSLAETNRRLEQEVRERKEAEAELLDFKTALDEHAIVAITDPRGKITYANDKFCAISKYAREELLGQDHRLVNSGHHPKAFIRELWETISGGRVWRGEIKNRAKDGTIYWVKTTIVPLLGIEGKPEQYIAIQADITARKEMEEALHRANDGLAQASRLKDEFLANMSHELRTPLNAILGLSEALLEQVSGKLTPRQIKSVTTISTSGQHLLELINDILDLSKVEAGKLELHAERLNLHEFCESCLVFVRTQAMHKHINVVFEPDGRTDTFSADPKRFKQILVNLLTNAVKFTPEGGRMGLTVAAPEDGDALRFTVWDTGVGIAAEDQSKLFRSFSQIDSGLTRGQEGTGLGLALVAKLVELHGGSVELESVPGKGSRFSVALPLITRPWPGSQPDATPPVEPDRRSYRRALIIEDEPHASDQLKRYLAELGVKSTLHPQGKEAVDTVRRERPDVILLDVILPDESGWVVLTKLKEDPDTRDIPVVVISVVDEPQKSRVLGAAAHFTKPVTREQLARFLQRTQVKKMLPVAPCAMPAPASGALILLAEDNAANRETIGGYLENKGYSVHYAHNGREAVQKTQELRPALILMDVQMPVMDGLTAMQEIRADSNLKHVPIVALTALAMAGDRERCLAAGATDYMSKPVGLKTLAVLMERLLDNSQKAASK